jgi:hypothetical protein
MDYKWVDDNLYMLFVMALADENRRYWFENRLATFNLETLKWRQIHIGNYCAGEISLNPYRMQVNQDNMLLLIVSSHGHPCTTFGTRPTTHRKRLLWVQRNFDDHRVNRRSERHSYAYRVPMPTR